MRLVLLPGMDGTGLMFGPFEKLCPKDVQYSVVPLSPGPNQNISEQVILLEKIIGKEPVVLVAESYSGILAYNLVQRNNLSIKKVIFVASFLGSPSTISKLSHLFPLSFTDVLPDIVLGHLLFGRKNTNELVSLFRRSLGSIDKVVLKKRLSNIAKLKEPKELLELPCVYIQASKDKLVSPKSINIFKKLCKNISIETVEGGHFIMQSNPKAVLNVLLKHASV